MRLTRHNGRSGKNGTYNPKHNDRRFDIKNSEHIDPERSKQNVYWDCYQGFHFPSDQEQEDRIIYSFEQVERTFYFERYYDFCEAQHERNRKTGHSNRDRTTDDLWNDKRTCPEETVLQIGTKEEHIDPALLALIAAEFFQEFDRRFGEHIHILDWALHLDESTPHIQERHVFDCENKYGEIAPQQEKTLEVLGFDLPYPDMKRSKINSRKISFDAACRTMLFDICKKHGLHLEEEPEYGGRAYLEKQDYILMKQKEKIAEHEQEIKSSELRIRYSDVLLRQKEGRIKAQEEQIKTQEEQIRAKENLIKVKDDHLTTLSLRIEDTESFADDVAETAYEKAVEAVTKKVQEEVRNEDFELIVEERDETLNGFMFREDTRRVIETVFSGIMDRFKGKTQHISERLASIFRDPETKKEIKKPIKESVLARLARGKAAADAHNAQRRAERSLTSRRKHNMEIG